MRRPWSPSSVVLGPRDHDRMVDAHITVKAEAEGGGEAEAESGDWGWVQIHNLR